MMDFETSNLVTVCCADHSQYVAIALRNLFDSKRGTDFDFRLGKNSVRAHRLIVELFLAPELTGTDQNEVAVPAEVKEEVPDDVYGSGRNILDIVLEFLYKGEVAVPEQHLEELLGVAKELDFQMLIDAVQVCRPIDINNEEELAIDMRSNIYCPEKVNEVGGFLGPHIEDFKCNRQTFVNTERLQLSMHHELTLQPKYYEQDPEDSSADLQSGLEDTAESLDLVLPNPEDDGGTSRDNQWYPEPVNKPCKKKAARRKATGHYKCPSCDTENTQYTRHVSHLLKFHGLTAREKPAPKRMCPNCDFQTSDRCSFRHHCLSVHQQTIRGDPAPKRKCLHCDFESSDRHSYQHHCLSVHQLTIKGEPAPKRKCPNCDFETSERFSYRHHCLSVHQLTIRGEPAPKRKCPNCEFETSDRGSYQHHCLHVHQRTLRGEPAPVHQCPECEYSSIHLGSLKKHLGTKHSEERSHACPHCSYVGKLKTQLKEHLNRVHGTAGSTFQCKVCGKRCNSHYGLRRHVRTHNERPFKCPHCSFDTNREVILKKHIRKVHQ